VKRPQVTSWLCRLCRQTGRERLKLYSVFTSSADRGERSSSCPSRLTPGKQSQYPLNRRLGGPQTLSGLWRREKSIALWNSNPDHPAQTSVTAPTKLSRDFRVLPAQKVTRKCNFMVLWKVSCDRIS
jgi:hypothetical protein